MYSPLILIFVQEVPGAGREHTAYGPEHDAVTRFRSKEGMALRSFSPVQFLEDTFQRCLPIQRPPLFGIVIYYSYRAREKSNFYPGSRDECMGWGMLLVIADMVRPPEATNGV